MFKLGCYTLIEQSVALILQLNLEQNIEHDRVERKELLERKIGVNKTCRYMHVIEHNISGKIT